MNELGESQALRVNLTEELVTSLVAGSIAFFHLQTGHRMLLSGEVPQYEKGQFVATWDRCGTTIFWECLKDCKVKPSKKRPKLWIEVHRMEYLFSAPDEDGNPIPLGMADAKDAHRKVEKHLKHLRVPENEEVRAKITDPQCVMLVANLPMSWRKGFEGKTIH